MLNLRAVAKRMTKGLEATGHFKIVRILLQDLYLKFFGTMHKLSNAFGGFILALMKALNAEVAVIEKSWLIHNGHSILQLAPCPAATTVLNGQATSVLLVRWDVRSSWQKVQLIQLPCPG